MKKVNNCLWVVIQIGQFFNGFYDLSDLLEHLCPDTTLCRYTQIQLKSSYTSLSHPKTDSNIIQMKSLNQIYI